MTRTADRVTQADVARCIRAGAVAECERFMLSGEISDQIATTKAKQALI
jgi:hypothetical protein